MAYLRYPDGDIEYHIHHAPEPALPACTDLVFLHEGLGSAAQWGRLPARLSRLTGLRALVFSRHGYGGSGGCPPSDSDYLTHQALHVLPRVLSDAAIAPSPILVGHSDGANIAAIYAARHDVDACVLIAPHIVFEDRTAQAIEATRDSFDTVAGTLSAFHHNPSVLFEAWSSVWLSPEFREYDITAFLRDISCPVVALQGAEDEYGSHRQLDFVAENVVGVPVETVLLPGVRHHPHLESMEATSTLIDNFLLRHCVIG